jgi:uncharacterized membrane protein
LKTSGKRPAAAFSLEGERVSEHDAHCFIVVCVVLAAIFVAYGLIFQKNSSQGKYSMSSIVSSIGKKRQRKPGRLPKNSAGWMTIFLAIVLLVLFLVFSKK